MVKVQKLQVTCVPSHREIFEAKGNKTSSMRDVVLDGLCKQNLSHDELINWNVCFEASKDAISLHVNKRVTLFFMQAVVCYNTQLKYNSGEAIHQGLKACPIKIDDVEFQLNAAHSATLPFLSANKKNKRQYVYLYRSGYYDESNSTIDLIPEVNNADRVIDISGKLRERSVELLNQVSFGSVAPDKAIIEFTSLLIRQIQLVLKRRDPDKVKKILEFYLEIADELHTCIS